VNTKRNRQTKANRNPKYKLLKSLLAPPSVQALGGNKTPTAKRLGDKTTIALKAKGNSAAALINQQDTNKKQQQWHWPDQIPHFPMCVEPPFQR
jgi:hypothetical protein